MPTPTKCYEVIVPTATAERAFERLNAETPHLPTSITYNGDGTATLYRREPIMLTDADHARPTYP